MIMSEAVSFVMTFIYVLILVAAVEALYKNYKVKRDIHKLCISRDEFINGINELFEYARTSDDIVAKRSNCVAHVATVIEASFKMCSIFRYCADNHISFNKEWSDSGLTVSKLYAKYFNIAVTSIDEAKSGNCKRECAIDYNKFVDGVIDLKDDEFDDWTSTSTKVLKNQLNIVTITIMTDELAVLLQTPY